ncbi:PDZ and LIM domain protein Zasp isoform X4 [Leptidea sinapis]|uniref:PDZ and LIM domain protein Zasp isoform X4 n=1 Tax=Leptidea sinapis TaxID=189913 RepID=UPI0021C3C944|nr:PDZ and LIM domain protein Zasp isoform X4 [Leptidea sinapis]
MAQLITVRLNKSDQQPLGFRLQGGKDFGTPLVVQKVNGGSAAERAGLQAGDALIRVNSTDVYTLRHQEAQDTIRAAGQALELTIQRGGGTWRPSVTPTGSLPRPGSRPLGSNPTTVTNTSLKANQQPSRAFGSGHNNVAKPFGYMNGTDSVKGIVNKQYNTPVNMYSDKTIAETLSAQSEVLAGGVLGVNFKKNEKTYDAEKSAVFKVLQEAENDPEPPSERPQFFSRAGVAPPHQTPQNPQQQQLRSLSRNSGTYSPGPAHLVPDQHHRPSIPVGCHQVLPDGQIALGVPAHPQPQPDLPVVRDTPFCSDCNAHIVGVFVRIKDKNLHVECFKCATCGTSLKNQGYYNLNGKLYCDIHAKLVARQNPPASNLEPVTVPPGGRVPSNTYSTPLPPLSTGNYTNGSSSLFSPSSNLSGPKPFGSSIGSAYSPSLSPRSAPMSPARPTGAPPAPITTAPLSSSFAPKAPVTIFKKAIDNDSTTIAKQDRSYENKRNSSSLINSEESDYNSSIYHQTHYQNTQKTSELHTNTGEKTLITSFSRENQQQDTRNQDIIPDSNKGSSVGAAARGKAFGVSSAPKRGRGVLNKAVLPGSRVPLCGSCNGNIRGPFITALGRIWCPEHFVCVNATCRRPLQDIGFVEENGQLYCEYCFEQYIAPSCDKCHAKIKGDCLNAIGKHFHPECFSCVYCGKLFGNNPFFLEDGLPYCEADWNELFTTKCFACGFPVEAGDRWVEALNNNYHSQCFNCTVCKKNLEGQSFFAKGGRPFCKVHAR